jgi:uncharacterized protein YbjT (DUF2867 family)
LKNVPKTALIAGATGLVGGLLLELLLMSENYERVIALVRRRLMVAHPKLVEIRVDFENLESASGYDNVSDIFCCLGTTIKKAGSQEAFEKVDLGYPLRLARKAVDNGGEQFCIVTALGADPESRVFYNRVKGKVEEAIRTLPFKSIHILRPSIILGQRQEFRFIERAGIGAMRMCSPLMVGKFRKYRPIEAHHVAQAMVAAVQSGAAGHHVYESDVIHDMAVSASVF